MKALNLILVLACSAICSILLNANTFPITDPGCLISASDSDWEPNKSVTIFDARTRALSSTEYAVEIVLINFANNGELPGSIYFRDIEMKDDGSGLDQVAGDGVYTLPGSYAFSSDVPYDPNKQIQSRLSAPVVHSEFIYTNELTTFAGNYSPRPSNGSGGQGLVEVTCDVYWGGSKCRFARWGLCKRCCVRVDLDSCSVTLGL